MAFAVTPPSIPSVPVVTGQLFPVRRIFCVGRNYAAHVREMGGDPDREPPFFFTKPADAVLLSGNAMPYPPGTNDLHHEIELVVAMGKGGDHIPESRALESVFGYAVGIDMTRRDLQNDAKKHGRPWDMAKGFDYSAPIGPIHPVSTVGHPSDAPIRLAVNGQTRQDGNLADMIWPVAAIIAYLTTLITLRPGDLIYTGTPDGVGPVSRGDRMLGSIEGLGTLEIMVD
jgi:fumarylpyruvate hydrolase